MKKLILSLFCSLAIMTAEAKSFPFLTFVTTDGFMVSVPSEAIAISFDGDHLVVGEKTFVISNLSKMYFSETDLTTGIETVLSDEWNDTAEIYDLKGRRIAKEDIRKGVYIVRTTNGTYKITAK